MLFHRRSKRLRKSLSSFKRKKVDVGRYVSDYYLENGLAYISCNVRGVEDIINRYSVKDYEWLNPEFAAFVEENANYIPVEHPIVLEICGVAFTDREKEVVTETIRDHYALRLGDRQLQLEANRNKAVNLLLLSVLISAIVTLAGHFSLISTVRETILILFWLAVWSFFETILFERRELRLEKTYAAQLACVKIVFNEKFRDEPLDNRTTEGFFEEIIRSDAEM